MEVDRHRFSLPWFSRYDSQDLFEKCRRFEKHFSEIDQDGMMRACHHVEFESGLDRDVEFRDPVTGKTSRVLCFDSNGYLGFQHHPSVKKAIVTAMDLYGAGTPSVPLLSGSSKISRELERRIARFHGREDALLFSSAYAANISVVGALVRKRDVVVHDQSVHASTIQGIELSRPKAVLSYRTHDLADLEAKLAQASREAGKRGAVLVLAEGVYSMEGRLLDLPSVRAACNRFGARLIVDECHSSGVLGPKGRGIEDHFGLSGTCDLIVGCFSKAWGFVGGYVTGPAPVILFLRHFAAAHVFSTALPAMLCAGLIEGIDLIDREPEHLASLKRNIEFFGQTLEEEVGLRRRAPSAIFKVPIYSNDRLFEIGSALVRRGLKCGVVSFPAVSDRRGQLRLTVTARHREDDMIRAASLLREALEERKILSAVRSYADH